MKFIYFTIFVLSFNIVNGQQVFDIYTTFNTYTRGNSVLEVPNEGYYAIGYNDSLSFDSLGQPNINYLQGIIAKYDTLGNLINSVQLGNGDTLYSQTFGGNSDDDFTSGILTSQNFIIAVGETQSFSADNYYDYDYWLVKFNSNLEVIWQKNFSIPDSQLTMGVAKARKIHDDGIVLPGTQRYLGQAWTSNFQLTAFDSTGTLIFHTRLLPQFNGELLGVAETQNHGFLATGILFNNLNNSDLSPIVISTDSVGNVQWYHILPYQGDKHIAQDIVQTEDGNYVYTWCEVVLRPGAQHKVWINHATKIDLSGNSIWSKDYDYSFDYYQTVKSLADGSLLMAGWDTDTISFSRTGIIRKCDLGGNVIWTQRFPGPSSGIVTCMDASATEDGGFILTGETSCCNFIPGLGYTSSLWISKTDSSGIFNSVPENLIPDVQNQIFQVYPNPASSICTVSVVDQEKELINSFSEIQLIDIMGRVMIQESLSVGKTNFSFDLTNYADGTYLLAIFKNKLIRKTKIIIIHH